MSDYSTANDFACRRCGRYCCNRHLDAEKHECDGELPALRVQELGRTGFAIVKSTDIRPIGVGEAPTIRPQDAAAALAETLGRIDGVLTHLAGEAERTGAVPRGSSVPDSIRGAAATLREAIRRLEAGA